MEITSEIEKKLDVFHRRKFTSKGKELGWEKERERDEKINPRNKFSVTGL